eukprot:6927692-Ditylum_brightwellii.AAC.1
MELLQDRYNDARDEHKNDKSNIVACELDLKTAKETRASEKKIVFIKEEKTSSKPNIAKKKM